MNAELDAITQTRGACPICAEDGKSLKRQLHGLASHLVKEHTVDQLVYQIAGEAIIAALEAEEESQPDEEQPKFARGGFVKGPADGKPIITSGCVIPGGMEVAFSREQVAAATKDATIAELKRQGKLRP
jgi:hypothetical protein